MKSLTESTRVWINISCKIDDLQELPARKICIGYDFNFFLLKTAYIWLIKFLTPIAICSLSNSFRLSIFIFNEISIPCISCLSIGNNLTVLKPSLNSSSASLISSHIGLNKCIKTLILEYASFVATSWLITSSSYPGIFSAFGGRTIGIRFLSISILFSIYTLYANNCKRFSPPR